MSANLFSLIEARAASAPEHPLLDAPGGRRCTYAQYVHECGRLAGVLAEAGARPGDRVAMLVDKSPEALFLYGACLRAGAIVVPLNVGYTRSEVEYFLDDAEPAVVVAAGALAAMVESLCAGRRNAPRVFTLEADGSGTLAGAARAATRQPPTVKREAADVAALIYTSGTTGRPKGVMLTHGNLAANARTLIDLWGFGPDDVLIHALPIFHVHGLFVACHCAMLSGARMIFLPRFEPGPVVALFEQATVLMGVPTFYTRLLAEPGLTPAACAHMRLFISGSAPLLAETFDAFAARTGHVILERYGMSETGMNTSNPLRGARKAGTVGPPLPDVSVRIADERDCVLPAGEAGMVQVRGPNVFSGYWRKPDRTAEDFTADGWFRTGDIGRFDADGYLAIVGRAKDLVISGGYNVYPKEVEDVVDRIPGVAESAVFGVPHPDFGEAVTAAVVRTGAGAGTGPEEIIRAAREHLAGYKVPKAVVFVDELPRNTMGKVQKALLRQAYAGLFRK
ncbi:MAG: AMP-binding protein [Gammaproteobacteria bacterium]